jgi:serpin B
VLALDLYRVLARRPGNLFASPHGVGAALAMVAAGARGRTRDELTRVLDAPDPLARYETLGRELAARNQPSAREAALARFEGAQPDSYGCVLETANALWHQRGYPIDAAYVAALEGRLGAAPREADFAGDRGAAVRAINAWAAGATHDRIAHIVDDLDPLTRVVLANAIYFKARWAEPFEPRATTPGPFATASGQRVDVPMMRNRKYFPYARVGPAQALELPYSGGAISMIVVLPDAGAFGDVERALDIERIAAALVPRMVQLSMPKFRVECAFMLRAALGELGVVDAFARTADFSAISHEPGFALDQVLHKTYVDLDEVGTEAAAVTMPMLCGAGMPRDIVELRIDRPFVFAIRDAPTGTVLFVGRVEDPG